MKNNKKGFTLVELVIVVAVMAVLVAVAIPTVSSIVNSAQEAVDNSNARTIESLIKLEEAELSNKGGTLGATDIDSALTEGKLGVDGYFLYDSTNGTVTVAESTTKATEKQFLIYCNTAGTVAEKAADDGTVVVTPGTKTE